MSHPLEEIREGSRIELWYTYQETLKEKNGNDIRCMGIELRPLPVKYSQVQEFLRETQIFDITITPV